MESTLSRNLQAPSSALSALGALQSRAFRFLKIVLLNYYIVWFPVNTTGKFGAGKQDVQAY